MEEILDDKDVSYLGNSSNFYTYISLTLGIISLVTVFCMGFYSEEILRMDDAYLYAAIIGILYFAVTVLSFIFLIISIVKKERLTIFKGLCYCVNIINGLIFVAVIFIVITSRMNI